MTVTYSWNITSLACIPSTNGMANVVSTVFWQYVGTDGTNTADVRNFTKLSSPDANNFIAFANLNTNTIVGWVTSSTVDINALQTVINTKLTNMISPSIITYNTTQFPWGNT